MWGKVKMDVMKYLIVLQALYRVKTRSIQAYRLHLRIACIDKNIGTREGQNMERLHALKC